MPTAYSAYLICMFFSSGVTRVNNLIISSFPSGISNSNISGGPWHARISLAQFSLARIFKKYQFLAYPVTKSSLAFKLRKSAGK